MQDRISSQISSIVCQTVSSPSGPKSTRSKGRPRFPAYGVSNAASASRYQMCPLLYCLAKLAEASIAKSVFPTDLSPTIFATRPKHQPPPKIQSRPVHPVEMNLCLEEGK